MAREGRIRVVMALCVVLVGLCAPAEAQFGGGTGRPNDPHKIYTPEQMNAIGANPGCWDKHFLLCADLDLSAYTGDEFNIIGTDSGMAFTGVFDGNGHTLSGLTCVSQDVTGLGLFGYVADPNAEIKNLGLIAPCLVTETASATGSLVGYFRNGIVMNCYVLTGTISGQSDVGGLIGLNSGIVRQCYVEDVNVAGQECIGALIGFNCGEITACEATGTVSGDQHVGGLAGVNTSAVRRGRTGAVSSAGYMTGSQATASVVGQSHVGGLAGANYGTVERCYARGTVTGTDSYIGGLIGYNDQYYSALRDCYSQSAVTGGSCVGGLMGYNGWGVTVANCYSTGSVAGQDDVGGLIGYSDWINPPAGCFWDIQTSGVNTSDGGFGKSTSALQMASTYIGWGPGAWTIDEGNDYPRLGWEDQPGIAIESTTAYPAQTGTKEDPILVYTAEEMALIGWVPENWDKHFKLMADIDMSAFVEDSYCVIGTSLNAPFRGVFDGNGHTISNFSYRSKGMKYIGLFGVVDGADAVIKNVGLVNPKTEIGDVGEVTGTCYQGTLAGYLGEGAILNCYAQGGTVSGDNGIASKSNSATRTVGFLRQGYRGDFTGGLVGHSVSGFVGNCYSTVTVYDTSRGSGGLMGGSLGTVANCYWSMPAPTDVPTTDSLVGYRYGTITASFWNAETCGYTRTNDLTGLTTAEMMDIDTFLTAGWDFIGEIENGTEDIWWIDEGRDYPRLWWELPE